MEVAEEQLVALEKHQPAVQSFITITAEQVEFADAALLQSFTTE